MVHLCCKLFTRSNNKGYEMLQIIILLDKHNVAACRNYSWIPQNLTFQITRMSTRLEARSTLIFTLLSKFPQKYNYIIYGAPSITARVWKTSSMQVHPIICKCLEINIFMQKCLYRQVLLINTNFGIGLVSETPKETPSSCSLSKLCKCHSQICRPTDNGLSEWQTTIMLL